MPRTLITGAAGFTGHYLADALAARGHEVVGLVKSVPADAGSFSALHEADLLDPERMAEVVTQVDADHVVHLAAIAQVNHGNIEALYRTNLIGSRNLFEALARQRTPLKSLLVASSANVYGNRTGGKIDETMTPVPANDYGVSKLAMENLARIYSERMPIIVTRPFNYTGVGQSTDFVIAKIVDHARRRANPLNLGNIDVSRDFSDVRMVAEAYTRLLETPDAVGRTVNVCSERATSLREVIALIERLSGHNFNIEVNPAFVRKNEVHLLIGSSALLREVIGDIEVPDLCQTLGWMLGA